ncbi:MAG: hypothetical protein KKA19_09575 [Candidatus Margulisbacteria bacterium]|nr:hypothetical protein [Candidatus Margulisiibacteriota bacterium]
MKIKFTCLKCGSSFEKDEKDITFSLRYCYCGGKYSIYNLPEIVSRDLDCRADELLDKYIRELGLDGAVELIERNKNQACAKIYFDKLRQRGIIK